MRIQAPWTVPVVFSLVLVSLQLTASQDDDGTFQCGDGTYSFAAVLENGRACPCSTEAFSEFVNMGCTVSSSIIQDDNNIYLAGLLDLDSFWWAEDIFNITVKLYNQGFFTDVNGVPLNNRTVTYKLRDSKCDEIEAIRAYWELRTENGGTPPDGVVGTRCSGSSLSLAGQLGVEGVPQVSPSATAGKLSDKKRYPEFSRLVSPQDERGEAAAMVALLRSFDWDEIAILSTDNSFSSDWETNLRKLWIGPHNDATGSWNGEVVYSDNIRMDVEGEKVDPESIKQTLGNFPKKDVRVIVLFAHDTDAFRILETAIETNFQPDTVWVGPASWVGREDLERNYDWLPSNFAPGWIGLTPLRNQNSYKVAFKKKLDEHLQLSERAWPELPVYSAETVDSIVLMAHAVDVARGQPGGGDATSVLRSLVFEPGVSGLVEFSTDGDRKDPIFTVLSMGKNGKWVEAGAAYSSTSTADVQMEQICWAEYGCALEDPPADTFPAPKVRIPVWAIVVLAIVIFALMALAFKYWRSTQSKKKLKNELSKLQKSIVGMRAAKMTYIPQTILEDDNRRTSIETNASPRVSSLILSASLKSTISNSSHVQWCWEETKGRMSGHAPSEIFGDPSNCWIKYDDFYNDMIEKAYQQQSGKGTVSLDPLDYVVDLQAKTQTKISTGFVRNVMRWKEPGYNTSSVTTASDADSTGARLTIDFPLELRGEPQMVLVESDVVQVSQEREDGWAFGTKLFHVDEEIVREFVKIASIADDAESGVASDICADTGWFPLDWATRPPTADDLTGLQKNLSDTGELEAPSHWDAVKNPLVAQRHKLDTQNHEYQQVAAAFLSTLKSRKTKIISIERIQNMGMWQSYVVKRQTICYRETELDHPQALQRFERCWLWHGTNGDVYEKIIQQGFNRSFCGKNATIWGKGVYFARDAEYSSREVYSVPDRKGIKYIMACRVMVGEYCIGKTDAITPDVRCSKTHSLYDSTVDRMNNPGIYVTYHDAQAYPEYVIRFKFLD